MSMLVYRYGIAAPHVNGDLVREQMRLAHRYRNVLTEIERGRRAAVRAAEAQVGDLAAAMTAVEQARAAREAASDAITKQRARTRSRSETAEQRASLKAAREVERAAIGVFREMRRRIAELPDLVAERDRIGELANELRRSARKHCGVSWGSYLLVEDAAGAAFSDTPMYSSGEATDPRFARWEGGGTVGVQLQGGLPVDEALGGNDTQLQITAPDPRAWDRDGTRRCDRRRFARHGELAIRVASEKGPDDRRPKPVWAKWRLDMDRPLPPGALIQRCDVHVSPRGPYWEWYVTMTLKMPDGVYAREGNLCATVGGPVAVDVGWRVIGDELRVACWRDAKGNAGELRLDARTMAMLREPSQIRSERDLRFDVAKAKLKRWIDSHGDAPGWLLEVGRTLHTWRSQQRMAAVWIRWGDWLHEHGGPRDGYDEMTSWYHRDHHEWACEARRRLRALRRRREIYRCFAADMARKYDVIVLEKFDKSQLARRQPTEAEKADNETARGNRTLAAVSELCSCLTLAARARCRGAFTVPAADSTRTCGACGKVESFDAEQDVAKVCGGCGAVVDQDDNAAGVLLERYIAAPGEAKSLLGKPAAESGASASDGAPPDGETRWARAKRLRVEKEARIATSAAE